MQTNVRRYGFIDRAPDKEKAGANNASGLYGDLPLTLLSSLCALFDPRACPCELASCPSSLPSCPSWLPWLPLLPRPSPASSSRFPRRSGRPRGCLGSVTRAPPTSLPTCLCFLLRGFCPVASFGHFLPYPLPHHQTP